MTLKTEVCNRLEEKNEMLEKHLRDSLATESNLKDALRKHEQKVRFEHLFICIHLAIDIDRRHSSICPKMGFDFCAP